MYYDIQKDFKYLAEEFQKHFWNLPSRHMSVNKYSCKYIFEYEGDDKIRYFIHVVFLSTFLNISQQITSW